MQINHPTEEAMERFLLHQSRNEELEFFETHILGCEGCVARLERLGPEIASTKLALEQLLAAEPRRPGGRQHQAEIGHAIQSW